MIRKVWMSSRTNKTLFSICVVYDNAFGRPYTTTSVLVNGEVTDWRGVWLTATAMKWRLETYYSPLICLRGKGLLKKTRVTCNVFFNFGYCPLSKMFVLRIKNSTWNPFTPHAYHYIYIYTNIHRGFYEEWVLL